LPCLSGTFPPPVWEAPWISAAAHEPSPSSTSFSRLWERLPATLSEPSSRDIFPEEHDAPFFRIPDRRIHDAFHAHSTGSSCQRLDRPGMPFPHRQPAQSLSNFPTGLPKIPEPQV